jgi:hypothetical protein
MGGFEWYDHKSRRVTNGKLLWKEKVSSNM